MKIFNVSLRVSITQIAEIPDNPPEPAIPVKEPFNDDPLDKQEKILSKYMDRLEKIQAEPSPLQEFRGGIVFPGDKRDGASMSQNIKISAETFEDLSAILKKFSDVSKTLPTIPESLLTSALPNPNFTPIC